PIRLSLHAFAHEARALGVADRPVVEPVDLELQSMEAELLEEVALELARSLVPHSPPAEVRVHRQAAEPGDPGALVADLERHRPGRPAVELDDEQAVLLGLALRALDRGEDAVAVALAPRRQVRLDLLVVQELDEEVDVARLCPPQPQGTGSTAGSRRRTGRHAPEPSATPPRISASPPSIVARSGSSRI